MVSPVSVEELYLLVQDILTKERFMDEIKRRRKEYGGLLDDEAIAYLIVDEYGRNLGNKMKIVELYNGVNATLEVKVEKILGIEVKKDGKYRIMRVEVSDDTGKCILVLWNDEIEEIGKNLKPGMKIKIVNGYARDNIYGLQISLGKWGIIQYMFD